MTTIDFFSYLAYVGCLLVVIGVVLEEAELLTKFRHELKCRKWVVEVLGKDRRTKLILFGNYVKPKLYWPFEVLGFGVLVIGLGVELLGSFSAERLQSDKNGQLESTNTLLSLQIEQLRSNNLALVLKADQTEKNAADAKLFAAQIGTTNAQLVADNLVLRSNVTALELAVQPRHFLNQGASIERLRQFSSKIAIACLADLECRRFSEELVGTLGPANWNVQAGKLVPEEEMSDGVTVEVNQSTNDANQKTINSAKMLVDELAANRVTARYMPGSSKLPSDLIVVFVGFKLVPVSRDANSRFSGVRVVGGYYVDVRQK